MIQGGLRLFLTGITVFLFSCAEKGDSPPTLALLNDSGLISHDTMLPAGAFFSLGLEAFAGYEVITNVTIKSSTAGTLLDSGVHTTHLRLNRRISKDISDVEQITVTVMDKARFKASFTLTITRDVNAAWGKTIYYPSLKLGAQASSVYPPCLSLQHGHVFPGDSASLFPELIDILYYYNPGGGVPVYASVFSSPGEADASLLYPFIGNWTIKNSTYYNTECPLTDADFYACDNDSLLIASYDEVSSKRKFRYAAAGNIIPFRIANGRKGLILVKEIQGLEAGYSEIAVKIQE